MAASCRSNLQVLVAVLLLDAACTLTSAVAFDVPTYHDSSYAGDPGVEEMLDGIVKGSNMSKALRSVDITARRRGQCLPRGLQLRPSGLQSTGALSPGPYRLMSSRIGAVHCGAC